MIDIIAAERLDFHGSGEVFFEFCLPVGAEFTEESIEAFFLLLKLFYLMSVML